MENSKFVVLTETDTAFKAARTMCERNLNSVVVCDVNGSAIGILSDRDITCRVTAYGRTPDINLGQIMSPIKAWVSVENCSPQTIVNQMIKHGVRKVPVLEARRNGQFKCVDVVTFDELLLEKNIRPSDIVSILRVKLTAPIRTGRRLNSYRRFMSSIAESLELSTAETEELTELVLGSLISRVQPDEAEDLLSQLPSLLRSTLSQRIGYGSTRLSLEGLIGQVSELTRLQFEDAEELLSRFFAALTEHVSAGEVKDVAAQLPGDVRTFIEAVI